jgi:hypothetical protein
MTVLTKQSSQAPNTVSAVCQRRGHEMKRENLSQEETEEEEVSAFVEDDSDHSSSSSSSSSDDSNDIDDEDGFVTVPLSDPSSPSMSPLDDDVSLSRCYCIEKSSMSSSTSTTTTSSSFASYSSSSLSTTSSTGRYSVVSFVDTVVVKLIPNARYDYTKEEIESSWYKRSELHKQRRTARQLAETMDFYEDEELFDRFGIQSTKKLLDRADRLEQAKFFFFHDHAYDCGNTDDNNTDNGSNSEQQSSFDKQFMMLSAESSLMAQKDANRIAVQLYGHADRVGAVAGIA